MKHAKYQPAWSCTWHRVLLTSSHAISWMVTCNSSGGDTHLIPSQLCYRGDRYPAADRLNEHPNVLDAWGSLPHKCYPGRRTPGPPCLAHTHAHTYTPSARELLSSKITQLYTERRQLEMPSKKDLSLNYYLQNMSIPCSLISFIYLFCRKDEALA